MKKVLALLLTLFMLISLAGCGSKSNQSSSTIGKTNKGSKKEPYKLTIWYWGEQEAPGMKNFMEEATKVYQQENPNVTIEAVLQESDTLTSAFRTAAASGGGPDIQFFWGGIFTLEDAWLGNIVPLSDYWTKDEINSLDNDHRAETFWKGKQWGMPFYQIGMGYVYNKDIFKKAGLDPENPPKTWNEFIQACDKIKKAGYTPISAGLKDGFLPGWLGIYLGAQNMNSMNELIDIAKGNKKYEGTKYGEWIYKVKDLIDKKYFNDDALSLDLYQGQQLFENGKVGMTAQTQPYINKLERAKGKDKIGIMKAPVYGNGKLANSTPLPCEILAITKSSKLKNEAADFLRFLHTDKIMKLMYDKAGAITPSKKFDKRLLNTETDKTFYKWSKTSKNITYQFYYPSTFEYEGLAPAMQAMFAGKASARDVTKKMDEAMKKWRDQNPNQLKAFQEWKVGNN